MKDFNRKDIMFGIVGILFGVVIILSLYFISVKIYEYNCDHLPITEALKDDKCRDYFNRTLGDLNE